MSSGFFEHNKGKIYFEVFGTGEAIVLIHGHSLDHRMWQDQVKFLSNKYQVVTYDMRGYGKSSVPVGSYSDHDDLSALLKHLNISKTNVIGLSLGGEVAIDFTLEYPKHVNKLIVADSSLGGYKSTVDWNVHAEEQGIDKGIENWLNHKVFETTRKNEVVKKKLENIVRDYSGWHWLNDDPSIKLDPRALVRLNEIKSKTLIIVGENDLDYFQNIANILNERITDSKMMVISGAGHMVNMEKPEEFDGIISRFLEEK